MRRLSNLIGGIYLIAVLLVTTGTTFIGPLGYAPFPVQIGPPPEPVVVTVWYGTEKQSWLQDAAQRFAATNPRLGKRPIQIVLRGIGSREQVDRVIAQNWGSDGAPTVIAPASSRWVETLQTEWSANSSTPVMSEAAQPLVLTPLVIAAWEERAAVLWPEGYSAFWQNLHDALVQPNWQEVAKLRGFSPESAQYQRAGLWGPVKFAHTSPLRSNSGAQALVLLAYGYHNKTGNLSVENVQDAGFQAWLIDIENAVYEFSPSTGTFMDDLVRSGPGKYDLAIVYENLAIEKLEAARRNWGDLRIVYPPNTIVEDHPYAILNAQWTTAEQRAAAAQFRDFLLSPPMQELAFKQYGFRPSNPAVSIQNQDPQNPFNRYQPYGVQANLTSEQLAPPPDPVFNALLEFWRTRVNR